jgi:hypothetical protein
LAKTAFTCSARPWTAWNLDARGGGKADLVLLLLNWNPADPLGHRALLLRLTLPDEEAQLAAQAGRKRHMVYARLMPEGEA